MSIRIFAISSLLVLFTINCAEAKQQVVDYIEVPVIYATSRTPVEVDGKTVQFDRSRNYEHADLGVSYGVVKVTIAADHAMTSEQKEMGCKSSSKKAMKHPKLEPLKHENDFMTYLSDRQKQKQSEMCVFVHGYNNSFDAAAASAARLELSLGRPVIMFSWPSQFKTKAYVVDECNAEWSLRPFQVFMQHVEDSVGPQYLMTVSHSMGNRLINWYLQSRNDKNNEQPVHYKEVVLTSPDIDRATFKNYFYKITNNTDKVRVYISAKDLPLRLSKVIHGNERAGSARVEENLRWQIPSNLPKTQVVDFTTVDSGWLGHSIQYDIISAMHSTDKPGDGLEMVEDSKIKGNFVRILRPGK